MSLLLSSCFCMLAGGILFGYNTGGFGGVLANHGFVEQLGHYEPSNGQQRCQPHPDT